LLEYIESSETLIFEKKFPFKILKSEYSSQYFGI